MIDFKNLDKILISDGALGTMLQKVGLSSGECPELWNITHTDDLINLAKQYADSGSDIITTNTFGGNRLKLREFNLEDKVIELNKKGVENARIGTPGKYIMASIGPTGQILEDEGGEITESELYDVFYESGLGFKEADIVICETFSSVLEAEIAAKAMKKATGLPIIITFTFSKGAAGYKTMMGASPERLVEMAIENEISAIGSNCGNGIDAMVDISAVLGKIAPNNLPIMIQANAGLPVLVSGITTFNETPSQMAEKVPELIKNGVKIIGGCCGTTPEHIKAIKEAVNNYNL